MLTAPCEIERSWGCFGSSWRRLRIRCGQCRIFIRDRIAPASCDYHAAARNGLGASSLAIKIGFQIEARLPRRLCSQARWVPTPPRSRQVSASRAGKPGTAMTRESARCLVALKAVAHEHRTFISPRAKKFAFAWPGGSCAKLRIRDSRRRRGLQTERQPPPPAPAPYKRAARARDVAEAVVIVIANLPVSKMTRCDYAGATALQWVIRNRRKVQS